MKAYIIRRRLGITVLAPYNPTFVDKLKEAIPYRCRRWEPESKSWSVDDDYAEDAIELVVEHYGDMEMVYERVPDAPKPPSVSVMDLAKSYPAAAILQVWPDASEEVVRAAYRARSRQLHPDIVGPTTLEAMKVLNGAYAQMEERWQKNHAR